MGFSLSGPPDAQELARLIFDAATKPEPPTQAQRPTRIILQNPAEASRLGRVLGDDAIRVEAGEASLAALALEAFADAERGDAGKRRHRWPPPWLHQRPSQEIREFLGAGRAFLRAEPWRALPSNHCIAARLGDAPWVYVLVMGPQPGTPDYRGVTLCESWQEFQTLTDPATPSLVPIEGVTIQPMRNLHPRDACHLTVLGLVPSATSHVFMLDRLENAERTTPRQPLGRVTAILRSITAQFPARPPSNGATLEPGVTLHYPCQGPM